MMEAVRTSVTSVNFYKTTQRYIAEAFHFLIRRLENLKSHLNLSPLSKISDKCTNGYNYHYYYRHKTAKKMVTFCCSGIDHLIFLYVMASLGLP